MEFGGFLDLNKLKTELIKKQQKIQSIQEHSILNKPKLEAIQRNYETRIIELQHKYKVEKNVKTMALEKLETMQLDFDSLHAGTEEGDIWRLK